MEGYQVELDKLTVDDISRWNEFHANQSGFPSPFTTHEYCSSVHCARGDVRVFVFREAGMTTGYLPFQLRNQLMATACEKVGGHMSDYFNIIGPARRTANVMDFLEQTKLSQFWADHVPDDLSFLGDARATQAVGLKVQIPDFPSYLRDLSSLQPKFISGLRRARKQLCSQFGEIGFSLHTNQVSAELERMLERKRAQYQVKSSGDAFSEDWTRTLLEVLLEAPVGKLKALLSTLYVGETWLSSCLSLGYGDVLHIWFPVYDPAHRRYSPGNLLFLQLFEEGAKAGYSQYDFGLGDAEYKRRLGGVEYPLTKAVSHSRNWQGNVARLSTSVGWRFDAVAKWAASL